VKLKEFFEVLAEDFLGVAAKAKQVSKQFSFQFIQVYSNCKALVVLLNFHSLRSFKASNNGSIFILIAQKLHKNASLRFQVIFKWQNLVW